MHRPSQDGIRSEVSTGIDVAVRKAERKARELQEEFPTLTSDERAMLVLYTMELEPSDKSIYFAMNKALRARDCKEVKVWRYAIWLLVTAMHKLPRVPDRMLFRGVKKAAEELGSWVPFTNLVSWPISRVDSSIGMYV